MQEILRWMGRIKGKERSHRIPWMILFLLINKTESNPDLILLRIANSLNCLDFLFVYLIKNGPEEDRTLDI